MSRKLVLSFAVLSSFVVATPSSRAQYEPSIVMNAACVSVPLPTDRPPGFEFWIPPATSPVSFELAWSPAGAASLACDLKVPVYSVTEINRMVNDLRDQVLKAVKEGVVQAAIKSDQVQSVSDSIQRTVEREVRAGLLREVAELRQQVQALEQRLHALEEAQ